MVTGVVRWLPHSFDFHFPLSAAARQTSMTPPPPLLYSCHRANTFACDEPRASGAISHDIWAIKSLQIALYRRDDGPVLISLYYPRLLSCGYAVTRPNHPRVLACHRAGVRTAKLSVSSLLLLYLSEEGEDASARICRRVEGTVGIKVHRSQLSGAQSDNSLGRYLSPPSYYPQCISLR